MLIVMVQGSLHLWRCEIFFILWAGLGHSWSGNQKPERNKSGGGAIYCDERAGHYG